MLGGDGGLRVDGVGGERSIHDCTILSESLPEVGFVLAITFESAVFFSSSPRASVMTIFRNL